MNMVTGSTINAGTILITGIGTAGNFGVGISGSTIASTGGGSIDIRGRGGAAGISISNSTIQTQGAPGALLVSGESTGSSSGVGIGGTSLLGGPTTTGNVIVRATNQGPGDSIQLSGTLQTTGVVNLRPGGVTAIGALSPANADLIEINGATDRFSLSSTDLATVAPSAATLVIGSNEHTGRILIGGATPFATPLTLQNAGAGSQGIAINGSLT